MLYIGPYVPIRSVDGNASNRVPDSTRARKPAMETGCVLSVSTFTHRKVLLSIHNVYPFSGGAVPFCITTFVRDRRVSGRCSRCRASCNSFASAISFSGSFSLMASRANCRQFFVSSEIGMAHLLPAFTIFPVFTMQARARILEAHHCNMVSIDSGNRMSDVPPAMLCQKHVYRNTI